MYKGKKSIIFKLMICIFIIVNTVIMYFSLREKDIITNYINEYYNQLVVSEEVSIGDNIENLFKLSINVDAKEDEILSKLELNNSSDYLTKNLKSKLYEKGRIPNLDLINYGLENDIDSFDLNNIKFIKKEKNYYEVSYDIVLKDDNKNKKLISHDEVYKLKKENKALKIDYIEQK